MIDILIQLDDSLASQLNRVVPPVSRKRSAFIRSAIQKALWELEEKRIEESHRAVPDTASDAIDLSVFSAMKKPKRRRRR